MSTSDPLSVSQAAQLLGKSPSTVLRLIRSGTLPATKLGPGTAAYVIERSAVESLAASETAA